MSFYFRFWVNEQLTSGICSIDTITHSPMPACGCPEEDSNCQPSLDGEYQHQFVVKAIGKSGLGLSVLARGHFYFLVYK